MRHTDIAIAGGGLAGALAAAMLQRAGIDAVLIDPHPVYPDDFRCEKIDAIQMKLLQMTGFADAVIAASTPDQEIWLARAGRLLDKEPATHRGIRYDTLVNTFRALVSDRFICAKVTDVAPGADRQTVTLSTDEQISARLLIVATGLNIGLRHKLGITQEVISANHSISIGFDVEPVGRAGFPFTALTYFTERPADRMGYLSLFSVATAMRANLFAYRDMQDPWLRDFRRAPQQTLYALWPALRDLMGDFTIPDTIKIRPVDLYVTKGYRQPGIVLVGDAFATSCPAAGTGARKVLVDVERLCNVHIPHWLASPGMSEKKVAEFYDDPVKQACDTLSAHKAYAFRSASIDPGLRYSAMRAAKFARTWGKGVLQRLKSSYATRAGRTQEPGAPWLRGTPVHK